MKPDPSYDAYLQQWASMYQANNYDGGLMGYFLRQSHRAAEKRYGVTAHFAKVLEVGAGTSAHLEHVRHSFDEYWITDRSMPFLEQVYEPLAESIKGRVHVACEDATMLSYSDASFDRLIAAHVLEHIHPPHVTLREWSRVVRPGGEITLVLPCDPGLWWRLGRSLVSRPKFKRAGLDYDYWMAREHVNPINNLVALVRYYFDDVSEIWWPFGIPSIDLNLFLITHIRV